MRAVKPLEQNLPSGKCATQILALIMRVLPKNDRPENAPLMELHLLSHCPFCKCASPTLQKRTIPNLNTVCCRGDVKTSRDTKGQFQILP